MINSALGVTFPDLWVPDKDKQEDYHKRAVMSILGQTVSTGFIPNLYTAMDMSMRFYNSDYDLSDKFDFMERDYNGRSLPALWINYNKIRSKINLLEGEMTQRPLVPHCKTVNKDAATRKMKRRASIITNNIMFEVAKELDPEGELIPEVKRDFVPHSEEELDLFMQSSYKENVERVAERILEKDFERLRYRLLRLSLWRDILITGRAIVKHEMVNNKPNLRRIDPRYAIVDPYCFDDMLSDASFVGEWRYAPLAEAAQDYGLSLEELDELRKDTNTWIWGGYTNGSTKFMLPFMQENAQWKTLVFYAEWKDIKQMRCKVTVDKYGNEHVKFLNKDDKGTLSNKEQIAGSKVETRNIETVRKATLVGGSILKEWGEMDNQVRTSVDDVASTQFSYTFVSPQYVNFRSVSKVEEISALQEFKDLIMYTIQTEMSTAGRKGFVYDTRYKPDNLSVQDVLYFLKVAGIAFTDSGKEAVPPSGNPFPVIDNSLTDAISKYMELSNYVDLEMDRISGINDARQGFQKPSTLVGVNQMSLVQSSLITEPLFAAFRTFENVTLQKYVNFVKTTWSFTKELYATAVGELGVNMFEIDEDFELQDYSIYIDSEGGGIMSDRSKFEQMVMAAVQQGGLGMDEALVLLYEPNLKDGVKKYLAITERKASQQQQSMAAQEEAIGQREAQATQASTQSQIEVDKAKSDNKAELTVLKEELKNSTMKNKAMLDEFMDKQKRQFELFMETIREQENKKP